MAEHGRCRICTSNDEDALVDHIAGAIWKPPPRQPGRSAVVSGPLLLAHHYAPNGRGSRLCCSVLWQVGTFYDRSALGVLKTATTRIAYVALAAKQERRSV